MANNRVFRLIRQSVTKIPVDQNIVPAKRHFRLLDFNGQLVVLVGISDAQITGFDENVFARRDQSELFSIERPNVHFT